MSRYGTIDKEAVQEALHYQIRDSVFDSAETSGTDILSSDLDPLDPPGLFRVVVVLDTATTLSYAKTRDGNTITAQFNGGNSIPAGAAFSFDHPVQEGDSVNYRVGANANVDELIVQEILAGT